MGQPIVFISRFKLRSGMATAFAAAFADAVRAIDAAKPRTSLYAAYTDAATEHVRIVHAFPDAMAMLAHFEGANERASTIADLVEYAGFELYGPAPEGAVGILRDEAGRRGVELATYPAPIGGFLR